MRDVAVETLPKIAVLMRRGGKWRERVSCLISDEHQTQATPFLILSLSLSLFLSLFFPSLTNCEAVIQHARCPVSQHAGLHSFIPSGHRLRGHMQTTDRAALKRRAQPVTLAENLASEHRKMEGMALFFKGLSWIP